MLLKQTLVEGVRGGDGCALLAMAERKTRKYIMRLLPGKGSQAAKDGVAAVFAEYGAAAFKTLTFDSGSEFAEMAGLCSGIGAAAYFTHPNSSWEKGTVERRNGLARLAAPKGARLGALPFGAIEAAERAINALPRRILGYKSPEALFEAELDRLYGAPV
ncbi:MAG: IS30 family transposase [Eubacteriaceae bacterium]|jgi:IS30 family transposase|nr:IS30 family transposase [Eubacteriaceae bacterium]